MSKLKKSVIRSKKFNTRNKVLDIPIQEYQEEYGSKWQQILYAKYGRPEEWINA